MAWFMVYNPTTGRLITQASQIPAELPGGLQALDVGNRPPDNQMWDEATRQLVDRPTKVLIDRLDDLADHPSFDDFRTAFQALSPANRALLRTALIRLLGNQRFRNASERVDL